MVLFEENYEKRRWIWKFPDIAPLLTTTSRFNILITLYQVITTRFPVSNIFSKNVILRSRNHMYVYIYSRHCYQLWEIVHRLTILPLRD